MKRLFRNTRFETLFGANRKEPLFPLEPTGPFLAVGDLHGRADLFRDLARKIPRDCQTWPLIFVGDYIDRGDNTKELLKLLMKASRCKTRSVTCLMGNHEQMLLDFIDDPQENAGVWLQNGGLQTLASFGVSPTHDTAKALASEMLRDRLVKAMGGEMLEWLRMRPLAWHSGNVWAVHAGADPHLPMTTQSAEALLWGHPKFRHVPRQDGRWILHGHSIVEEPTIRQGRIALDTGAYATGLLTAAAVTSENITFFQTNAP